MDDLTEGATAADIVRAKLRLQPLPKITLKDKKVESLMKKYKTISEVYLPSYPRGEEYMKKKMLRKDDDEDNELSRKKKKKKKSTGKPRKVDMIEKNTIQKHLIQPHRTTVLKKCSAEENGSRNGAGTNQASCAPLDPQVEAGADNSDDDLFESESEAEVVPEKTARKTVSKVPKKIPRQAGEWKAKKIKV